MRVYNSKTYSLNSELEILREKVEQQDKRLSELASEIEKLKQNQQQVPELKPRGKSKERFAKHDEHARRFMQFRQCMNLVNHYSKKGGTRNFPSVNVKGELTIAINSNTFLIRKAKRQDSDDESSDDELPQFPTDQKPYPKCSRQSYTERKRKGFAEAIKVKLPASILSALRILEQRKNTKDLLTWDGLQSLHSQIPITWMLCYVRDILPDTREEGWQRFQCSHLCTNGRCVTDGHLVWESSAVNRGRGGSNCRQKCNHDNCNSGLNVCECTDRHFPPCI